MKHRWFRIMTLTALLAPAVTPWLPLTSAAEGAGKPELGYVNAAEYASLQAAVDALPRRMGTVFVPPGEYTLEKTLDLSSAPGGYQGGIRIVGSGRATRLVAKTRGQPAIDLTGTNHCILENLWIVAENVKPEERPNVGLLLARNLNGGAAQEHRFTNVQIVGQFTVANVYNVTSELCRFIGCTFINTAPGSHNLVWSSENYAGVKSPARGDIRTFFSNTELRILGCTFYNWGGGKDGTNLYLRGFTMDTTVRDCYMNPPQGGCAVHLAMSGKGGPVESASFENIRIEGENAVDIFRADGRHENLTLRGCTVVFGEGLFVRGEEVNTLTLQNNLVWNVRGWKTAMRFKRLLNSRIAGNIYRFDNWGGKNPQDTDERVLTGELVRGCRIEVARRDLVNVETMENTVLDALDDGGVRRTYLGPAAAGTVLNLTPSNTATLKNMKRGDVALDDGTNTESGKPALAVFDGTAWQYMN